MRVGGRRQERWKCQAERRKKAVKDEEGNEFDRQGGKWLRTG